VIRWIVLGILAIVLFAAGVALGQALEDRPEAGKPVTRVATIEPWTQTNRITVTVTAP